MEPDPVLLSHRLDGGSFGAREWWPKERCPVGCGCRPSEGKLWAGDSGMPTDAPDKHTIDRIRGEVELDYESLTVFVDDSDFDGYYLHFCKPIFWPVSHY